ncbi:chromosome segregation protein Csm1/Pcs1-domain-containing protein [Diplogelasinospora grovesii]|uniref:Chromosome segregation protein Csm1/Pcs1-domain-containing protein n=1 Tax=Diplogelasinospora grovesii TaxID=303347 RepID=A0AAN6NFC8_9PEZI|nr:chromosome segregation protein Csm1/Pcs1-domain-containing protein [Diplogelasinospora grovesii]
MSRAKVRSNLLELVDSDSEDGLAGESAFDIIPLSKRVGLGKTMAPAKKGTRAGGRQAATAKAAPANKVTKQAPKKATATTTRRGSGRLAAAVEQAVEDSTGDSNAPAKKPAARGRRGKKAQEEEETEGDSIMVDASAALASPPGTDADDKAAKPKTTRGRPKRALQQEEEVKEVPDSQPPTKPARAPRGRKPAAAKKGDAALKPEETMEIPETQPPQEPEEMQIDLEEVEEEEEQVEDLPVRHSSLDSAAGRARVQAASSPTKRPPLYDSSLDGGDVTLRRRLGEMTQKYESLEQKYRDLRDIAVREAEKNFDRLRKQSEEKSATANQLIASLKAELAGQKELAKDGQKLKKQLEASEAKVDGLQTKVTELTTALAESKTEIKALNMRLTAARTAEASATAAAASQRMVPGSAMKGSTMKGGMHMQTASAANAQQATLTAQMKEDLYGDLTGLIVRGVKRDGGEDVYDCIQTGRNGTLHFKLSIATDGASDNYEDAQFLYVPQLDPSRDRPLIDMLPDYLVEEITFPRPHAAKFYARVMKALTERVVEE